MDPVLIRHANLKDAEMLAALSFKTFYDAFHDHPKNAPEDMAAYMDEAFSTQTITKELSDSNSIFILAEIGGEAVGYAKVTLGSIEKGIEAGRPIELNRLYATQDQIGKGIGQKLIDECFKVASEHNCDVMWLGVWEYNPRAQRFYEKQGFKVVGEHVFLLGKDPQIDLLMQKELLNGTQAASLR
ncbi:MAG: GNAT family N-acetyltransferase [Acidobacteria bacterium]|nr:GNAT family N-acetyltransferase [Acidobacteriota bacterium]